MPLDKQNPGRPNWPTQLKSVSTNTSRALIAGFALIVLTLATFGVWSTTVPISSAVVANGQVVVATKRRQIQHPTGGVIRALRVDDGSAVKEGDVLIELEDADASDRFTRARDSFYVAMASAARLEAEAEDKADVAYTTELAKAAGEQPAIAAILEGQRKLFAVRRVDLRGQLSIVEEQHEQLKKELAGLTAERAAATTQIGLTHSELRVVEDLFAKGYTTRTRVYGLRRDIAQLAGSSGRLEASAARVKSAMIENELKLLQVKNQLQTAINAELRDVQAKIPSLREQYRAARDAYDRMVLRAPAAGTVMASRINTIGAVVRPGETVLEIVPADDRLMVEVQLRPGDIDSVHPGLTTEVRLTGLNQRTAPPLAGRVTHVSADSLQDARTGATYFVAHIDVPERERARLGADQLQPGMPASVMIKTGERTALAYLTQPLTDSITRAWREQ